MMCGVYRFSVEISHLLVSGWNWALFTPTLRVPDYWVYMHRVGVCSIYRPTVNVRQCVFLFLPVGEGTPGVTVPHCELERWWKVLQPEDHHWRHWGGDQGADEDWEQPYCGPLQVGIVLQCICSAASGCWVLYVTIKYQYHQECIKTGDLIRACNSNKRV